MKKILTYLFLGLGVCLYAQNEGSYFYFNNFGGLSFDRCSGQESPVFDGQSSANTDQILVGISNSTISDHDGNLLLYSNGLTVYDRNHNPLPAANELGGTGLQGKGNSLILPQPGSDHLYYIFTVDNGAWWNASGNSALSGVDDGTNHGLEFSIIDLNLNDGFGDIVPGQKRIHLITYNDNDVTEIDFKCSRKLTAVRSPDCSSYWIITHFLDKFYAFKLDENGLDRTPVISTTNPEVPINSLAFGSSIIPSGDLKVSSDGTKLAMTYANVDVIESNSVSPKGLYIYDLDPSTGLVSNSVNLILPPELIDFDLVDYYATSLEFSIDGNYLYATSQRDSELGYSRKPRVWRWRTSAEDINTTIQLVYETDNFEGGGSLQLGPNGKIFHVRELQRDDTQYNTSIGVFSNPTDTDLANVEYNEFGVQINNDPESENMVITALPQMNPQWFNEIITISDNTLNPCRAFICGDQSAILSAPFESDAEYTWYLNDEVIVGADANVFEVEVEGDYRVEVSYGFNSCKKIGYAEVIESDTAPEVTNATVFQCDDPGDEDGIAHFRLAKYIDDLVPDSRDVDVRFYLTRDDAENLENELDSENFINTANPQIVYAAVSNLNDGCFSIAELELVVSSLGGFNDISLKNCDSEGEIDGFATFNLDESIPEILSGFVNDDYRVTFYETEEKAQLDEFELFSPYTNIVAFNQTLFARVESDRQCLGIQRVQLIVEPPPNIDFEIDTVYCLDQFPETITLESGLTEAQSTEYEFQWSNGETSPTIEINEPGVYTVQMNNGSDCPLERTINVTSSSIPEIENIIVDDFGTDNSLEVIVSGDGDYEYSVFGNNAFTSSPRFEDLPAGIYNLRIRDKNGCGVVEELISLSGFPKFFTPNGDGVNDTWSVKNLNSRITFTGTITIYDRYGKLLYTVQPNSFGWDGMYEGRMMPNSDYWFKAELTNGETFSGHFALRR